MENAIKGYNHQGPHPWIDICADYTRMIDNKDIFSYHSGMVPVAMALACAKYWLKSDYSYRFGT